MAGEIKHPDVITILTDPAVTAAGGVTPEKFNKAMKLSGGTDKQLLERSTAADGTTGMNLTSTPTVTGVIFPLTAPSSPANGSFWVEDDGVTLKIWIKRADGTTVSLEL